MASGLDHDGAGGRTGAAGALDGGAMRLGANASRYRGGTRSASPSIAIGCDGMT